MNDYHKEIDISKEKQNIINEYINKYSEEIYEKDLPEIISAEEMYYLTTVSQNLLNWYPFSKEDSVLEIGGDLGQLTGLFSKKCKDFLHWRRKKCENRFAEPIEENIFVVWYYVIDTFGRMRCGGNRVDLNENVTKTRILHLFFQFNQNSVL